MTPCEKLGYKVGDKFKVINPRRELKKGDIVELGRDDGSDIPVFIGDRVSGQIHLKLERVKPLPKLTKSKQWLADAIHNRGAGWPDGAKWACYSPRNNCVMGVSHKPSYDPSEKAFEIFILAKEYPIFKCKPFPNWHQTVLSRDEYFSVYPNVEKPEPDYSPVGHCKCVSNPVTQQADTLDTLMKRWEDAKALVQQAHDAVTAELERRGWGEPTVLSIGWDVGDKCIVVKSSDHTDYEGQHAVFIEYDDDPDENLKYRVKLEKGFTYWVDEIKRP